MAYNKGVVSYLRVIYCPTVETSLSVRVFATDKLVFLPDDMESKQKYFPTRYNSPSVHISKDAQSYLLTLFLCWSMKC